MSEFQTFELEAEMDDNAESALNVDLINSLDMDLN